jgi:hypothetical protein
MPTLKEMGAELDRLRLVECWRPVEHAEALRGREAMANSEALRDVPREPDPVDPPCSAPREASIQAPHGAPFSGCVPPRAF